MSPSDHVSHYTAAFYAPESLTICPGPIPEEDAARTSLSTLCDLLMEGLSLWKH